MAALKLLLSSARRHCLSNPQSRLHPSPFLSYHRSLSSESDPNPNQNPPQPPRRQPVPVEPVSYTLKPKEQSLPDPDATPQAAPTLPPPPQSPGDSPNSSSQDTRATWTREEARFIRDVPSISPVSYPVKVAPLPEDRVAEESGGGEGGAEKDVDGVKDLEGEKRRIEADGRMRRRLFRVPEEEVVVPFPALIKVEKKESKSILEVMDAIRQVKANAQCKFDETVEAHVQLGIDAKRNAVRGNMTLPHGSGKVVRVAFFAEGSDAEEARAAGADIVGGVELVEEIASSHKLNVDKCFATNEMIMRLAKIARILRERGLMPDRKLGTVTNDITGALQKVRQGHIEYRMDRTSIVHVGLGKVSFTEEYLQENIGAFMSSLLLAKPTGLKKSSKYAGYINSFHICSTMGPGFPVSIQSLSKAADHYNKVHLKA
ncbi:50S ribosomal protein L1 [Pyrus ussuriensis x Pyrus communis]|uniref:CL1 n=1 Tax=Pyrus ussuriensis x Pyrus communis TaxID=2448454 RepID=A0A5N5GBN8_9ROSA|nr:50S ribosomal protein L1 [Pyrus ussuriensis x Pyrus communis]